MHEQGHKGSTDSRTQEEWQTKGENNKEDRYKTLTIMPQINIYIYLTCSMSNHSSVTTDSTSYVTFLQSKQQRLHKHTTSLKLDTQK